MEEEWREIPGYEGYYEVSSLGRVRSLDRYVNGRNGSLVLRKGKHLKPLDNGNGYRYVALWRNNYQAKRYLHQLVAEVFIGPRPEGDYQAAHEDGDRSNNTLVNISWKTRAENELDKVRHGTARVGHRYDECVRGHDLTGRNRKSYKDGKIRPCWACKLMLKFFQRRGLNPKENSEYALEVSDIYYKQIMSGEDPYYEPDCNRGHLLEGSNLGIYKKYDKRYCRSCERARKRLNVNGHKATEDEIKNLADEIYLTKKGR